MHSCFSTRDDLVGFVPTRNLATANYQNRELCHPQPLATCCCVDTCRCLRRDERAGNTNLFFVPILTRTTEQDERAVTSTRGREKETGGKGRGRSRSVMPGARRPIATETSPRGQEGGEGGRSTSARLPRPHIIPRLRDCSTESSVVDSRSPSHGDVSAAINFDARSHAQDMATGACCHESPVV